MNPLFFPTLDKYNEFQLTLLLICVFPIFPTICINFIPGNLLRKYQEIIWKLEQNFKS